MVILFMYLLLNNNNNNKKIWHYSEDGHNKQNQPKIQTRTKNKSKKAHKFATAMEKY